jgi:phospholipase/carboxylesterase
MTTPARPPATLILLHGHDDDPAAAAEPARAMAGVAWNVVVPHGPVATGGGRRAWWRNDDDGAPVDADVAEAVTVVDDLVRKYAGVVPVVLGGFSQGGALALALALRAAPPADVDAALGGAFAIGSWLPDLVGLETDVTRAAERPLPVLIGHGEDDEAVPLILGRSAARLLARSGVPVTFVPLEVGHELTPFIGPVSDWAVAVARGELPSSPP